MNRKLQSLRHLLEIVDRLRSPGGCPWDRKQTLESLAPYLLEEACEAVDAIQSGSTRAVNEELGDLLMVVLMICRIGEESGSFDVARAADAIASKLVRRHPHVFAGEGPASPEAANERWERIKREEKRAVEAPGEGSEPSILADVPSSLPALSRAARVGQKAATVGFEWPDRNGPTAKIREELEELLEAADAHPPGASRIADELGDLLFAVVNLARHLEVDPELALRRTTQRFIQRFRHVESHLGKPATEATLEEMDALWEQAKRVLDRSTPSD